jgi:inorganic pyrophosphatase
VASVAEYVYNRRHFLVNPAKSFGQLTGAKPNELQQDSGWQRPAERHLRRHRNPGDCLFVDRFMATPMFYPANYGFIPNTLADDGDPLDVLVVTPYPVAPGSVIRARPVGILHMTDDGGGDAKVIAVPHDKLSQLYVDVKEYTDLPALLLEQIKHFFENYKDLEKGKWVKIEGWGDAEAARAEILKSVAAYKG